MVEEGAYETAEAADEEEEDELPDGVVAACGYVCVCEGEKEREWVSVGGRIGG